MLTDTATSSRRTANVQAAKPVERVKVHCGCGELSDIPHTIDINAQLALAFDHAVRTGHTVLFHGEIRPVKA